MTAKADRPPAAGAPQDALPGPLLSRIDLDYSAISQSGLSDTLEATIAVLPRVGPWVLLRVDDVTPID